MKKAALSLILIMAIASAPQVMANSVTYRVSARIPAIIGVNVPPFEDSERERLYNERHGIVTLSGLDDIGLEMTTQEIVRDNERIVLKTFVDK